MLSFFVARRVDSRTAIVALVHPLLLRPRRCLLRHTRSASYFISASVACILFLLATGRSLVQDLRDLVKKLRSPIRLVRDSRCRPSSQLRLLLKIAIALRIAPAICLILKSNRGCLVVDHLFGAQLTRLQHVCLVIV